MSRAPASAAVTSATCFSAFTNGGGGLQGIEGGLLLEDLVGERFEPGLLGDHGARPAFGSVRSEEILERRERVSLRKGGLEPVGEQIAFGEGFQDRLPALFDLDHLGEAIADGGDGHFIQAPGGFLAVAGDERNGGSFGEQAGRRGHLSGGSFEFGGDAVEEAFVHARAALFRRSGA